MSLLQNYPLWASLAGITLAQAIKIPLHFFTHRTWKWGLLFSTGGMPSSHSAAVTALATAVGMTEGFGSTYFAIATIFAVIIMFDAAGVRRHAGEHAALLNILLDDFHLIKEELKLFRTGAQQEKREKLKELLGHKPIEVLIGGALGILIALGIGYIVEFN
ncbi:divergent PAP2 family protein [Ammoniphilus sp. CFH 90114]|uniref:divergent PAP2 family protein n=1 Tax=Ammoniphilus sp. CFH 90114 TaxID=2493665 RepID=UPI00100E217C|nr:divergent PAP2 family protein [Ammoniphilus sp. CFH 90114]RXT05749.1 divergent PAP2 family protein [Ammoniphilus sp. CFH 90114]